MKQPQKKGKPPTGFLDLPPELRNRVYELSLPKTSTVYFCFRPQYKDTAFKLQRFPPLLRTVLSLMRTGRQLHREFAPVFYGAYNFHFRNAGEAFGWISGIKTSIAHVRTIRVGVVGLAYLSHRPSRSMIDLKSWLASMSEAHDLQSLTLPDCAPYYRGDHSVLGRKARFLSKVALPLCRRVLERRKVKNPAIEIAEALEFLHCHSMMDLGLEVEMRVKSRLEKMLRTPLQEDRFETEVLQDIRRLFVIHEKDE